MATPMTALSRGRENFHEIDPCLFPENGGEKSRTLQDRRKSALSPFALRLSSHRSFIPSGSGLENQRTKEERGEGGGDQLEKLNYLAK